MNLEEFKARVSVIEWIQRHEPLTSIGGGEWQGSHAPKHSSENGTCLNVNEDGQWHCYSCDAKGGDAIAYEMDRQGCGFVTAVTHIAETLGLPIPLHDDYVRDAKKRNAEKDIGYAILNSTAEFYHNNLTAPAGYFTDRGNAEEVVARYFTDRGIAEEVVDELKLGYADKSHTALYKHLSKAFSEEDILSTGVCYKKEDGRILDSFTERYIFPYYDGKGVCYFIGRDATGGREYTDVNGKKKTVAKYKKLRKAENPAVQHVLWNGHNVTKDYMKPVLIVEGVVDAILARQELSDRYDVVSPTTTRLSKNDIEGLANVLVNFPRRRVIICNDTEDSHAGRKGAMATATKLREALIDVATQNNEDLRYQTDEKLDEMLPDLRIATLQKPPEDAGIDVADYIQRGWKERLVYWIESALPLGRYEEYLKNNPFRFFIGKTFKPKFLSDELRFEGRFYAGIHQELHRYVGGVYLKDKGLTPKVIDAKLWQERNQNRCDETMADLTRVRLCPEDRIDAENLLNTKNGLVDINTLDVLPHSPFIVSTMQVAVGINPNAECPAFDNFLTEIAPGSEQLIYEMIGYCLHNSAHMHKAFLLVGKGANGKSTLLKVIEKLLGGKDNVSHITLENLEESRFRVAEMTGKFANIYADLPDTPLKTASVFNTVVAGDTIQVEAKYKTPFDVTPTATQIFSCNEIPRSYTTTQGFYRRLVIVRFPKSFKGKGKIEQNKLVSSLTTENELEGILITALTLYAIARERGEFTISEESQDALTEYQQDNEPALVFFAECLRLEDGAFAQRSEIYNHYKEWLEFNGYRHKHSAIKLNKLIEDYFGVSKDGGNTKTGRGFEGLAFNECAEVVLARQQQALDI